MNPISRNTCIVLAMTLLSACATLSIPDYPRKHPANPEALAAPLPASAGALTTYKPAASKQTSPESSRPSAEESDHEHH